MDKCKLALANILVTAVTAAIEYKTAPTEEEGIRKIGERIQKNNTIKTTLDCLLDDNSNCKC